MCIYIPPPEISRDLFIGRGMEFNLIDKAIASEEISKVINIRGDGGIGKTSLLQEVRRRYMHNDDILIVGVSDFYHTSTNTLLGFIDSLVELFPPFYRNYFDKFKILLSKTYESELAGIIGEKLEQTRTETIEIFYEGYNRVAKIKRIVLLIDTFEMVQTSLRNDIIDWLGCLENTVTILAGRRNDEINKRLIEKLGNEKIAYIALEKFNLDDAKELFSHSSINDNPDDEEIEKLLILSQGLPILMVLAVDRRWPASLRGKDKPFSYSVAYLKNASSQEIDKIRREFNEYLILGVKKLVDAYDHARSILWMSIAHRFFSCQLLSELDEETVENAKRILDELSEWPFVKHDPKTGSYWLHDLVRDLVKEYAWPLIDRTGQEQKHIVERTIRFYDKLITEFDNKKSRLLFQRKRAFSSGNEKEQAEISKALLDVVRNKQYCQAQQIYYKIVLNYENGLIDYRSQFVYNLWVRELCANDILKQERDQALKELDKEYPEIEEKLNNAKNLIIAEKNYDAGMEILKPFLKSIDVKKEPYTSANVLLYYGIALVFKSEIDEAEKTLKESINIFEEIEKNSGNEHSEKHKRRIFRCLARANGLLGFGCMNAGRLNDSIIYYRKSISYSRKGEIDTELAYQLNDLSYVYARLGEFQIARAYWEKGMEIREQQHYLYPIGLSYNNRGMIEYLADNPYEGIKYSQKALALFINIGEPKAIAMAQRALGGLLTRKGNIEKSVPILQEAESYLVKAEKICIEKEEIFYLAETLERLGLLFNHLYNIYIEECRPKEHIEKYYKDAQKYFERCKDSYAKAGFPLNQCSAIARLCRLYIDANDLDKAENELKIMVTIMGRFMPDHFFNQNMNKKKPITSVLKRYRDQVYPLGKLEHRKARLLLSRYNFSKSRNYELLEFSAQHYALACAYLETYSINAFATKILFQELFNIIQKFTLVEVEIFRKKVEKTQKDYGLEDYPSILEWIEAAMITL